MSANELLEECRKLPANLSSAAEAIVHYASSLVNEDWQSATSGRWKPINSNFVTLKPQWKQAGNLAVTLRGTPDEYEVWDGLELKKDQNGYSAFRLENPDQIAAAFSYVRRAHKLFERGRTRSHKTPKTLEV